MIAGSIALGFNLAPKPQARPRSGCCNINNLNMSALVGLFFPVIGGNTRIDEINTDCCVVSTKSFFNTFLKKRESLFSVILMKT